MYYSDRQRETSAQRSVGTEEVGELGQLQGEVTPFLPTLSKAKQGHVVRREVPGGPGNHLCKAVEVTTAW
jgi:hypothetical protein